MQASRKIRKLYLSVSKGRLKFRSELPLSSNFKCRAASYARTVRGQSLDLSWQAWCWRAGDLSQIQLPEGERAQSWGWWGLLILNCSGPSSNPKIKMYKRAVGRGVCSCVCEKGQAKAGRKRN